MSTPLTIHEAARATGWSARMLRYVEQLGLVEAPRSDAGYRLYGPAQLARLRSLRELLGAHDLELGAVAVVQRLRREPELAAAIDHWFDAEPRPAGPYPDATADSTTATSNVATSNVATSNVVGGAWLAFEQAKHSHLLPTRTTARTETA
jgi:MerR family transcriptional regulator, copper efflux regulator